MDFLFPLQITASLFEYTWNFWKGDVQTILQNFSALSQCSNIDSLLSSDLVLIADRWFYGLKVVRQLIISGYESDRTSAQVVKEHEFLTIIKAILHFITMLV